MARTPRGTPPSYRRHSSGQACVTVRDAAGRRREILLGPWDSPESKAEYARIISELAAHQGRLLEQEQDQADPGGLTVNALILAFWKHAEEHYGKPRVKSATTELLDLRDALRPLREVYGRTEAREFGPVALRTVREKMIAAGLSRKTINARINRIRRVFRWAASVELIPVVIVQALETLPGLQRGRSKARETEEVKPVPSHDIEAALPFMPRPVAAMVQLQLLTGCRTEEVLAIRGCDLAPGEPNWEYRPEHHKTEWRDKERVIPVGPRAQEIVKEFLKADLQSYLFSPQDVVAELHGHRARQRKSKPTPSERARRIPGIPARSIATAMTAGAIARRSSGPAERPASPNGRPCSSATQRPRRFGPDSGWRRRRSSSDMRKPT